MNPTDQNESVIYCEGSFEIFLNTIPKVVGEKGWQALHAKPTEGSLGKGIWENIHITQVKMAVPVMNGINI